MLAFFSTAGRSGDDAFAQWRAAICEQFVPLRPEPVGSCQELFGELRSWPLGALTLTNIHITGQRIVRDRPEISHSDREAFFLTVQRSGETGLVCGDRGKLARTGDMYLVDARRPFLLQCEARSQTLALTIPREACGGGLAALDYSHGLVLASGDPVSDLLRDYICGVASADDSLSVGERADIADHLMALIGHALARHEPNASPPQQSARAALFVKAYRLIDRKVCDPEFDPACLARDTGVSLRQLQALFSEHDTSPMRSIFERRIVLAKKMLLDRAHARKTITQIAFECGFRDLSHFGRVFSATTGLTPRAWRRGVGASNPTAATG